MSPYLQSLHLRVTISLLRPSILFSRLRLLVAPPFRDRSHWMCSTHYNTYNDVGKRGDMSLRY